MQKVSKGQKKYTLKNPCVTNYFLHGGASGKADGSMKFARNEQKFEKGRPFFLSQMACVTEK